MKIETEADRGRGEVIPTGFFPSFEIAFFPPLSFLFSLPPPIWMTACWWDNYVWKAITQTQAPWGTSEICPWRVYERMTAGGTSPVMIAAAFMTLQQGMSDLSCLPTQPASNAVFNLKPVFTVSVPHALTTPYSSLICNLCFPNILSSRVAGLVVHITGRQKTQIALFSV